MSEISDGKGTGNRARVSGHRLFTHAISEDEAKHATEAGDAYNINTGLIGLTNSTASGVFYIKNNEERDLVVEAIAEGVTGAGTVSDGGILTVIRNPESVSFSTDVDINVNRNFGSPSSLSALAYKGAQGATVTGGDDAAIFYQGAGGRLYANIDFVLPKGSSMAITVDSNTTSGTTSVYVAAICHLKNASFVGQ